MKAFKVPDTALILAAIVVAAAVLTWVVPPGHYERTEMTVPGVGMREVVVPDTFRVIEREDHGVVGRCCTQSAWCSRHPSSA